MIYTTGQTCPTSGQYGVVGANTEITMVRGNTFPPYNGKKAQYFLADPTKRR